ncbi:hypothetical protein RJT34_02331 [Clitoria ternatea]|uniref:Prolamin-like domain-containing protein n=1 Tax=Clitoria ternatea TaxID=43366 RepID=A0AAN9Q0A7_CLITE
MTMARLSKYLMLVAFFMVTTTTKILATSEEESVVQCAILMGSRCGKQVTDKLSNNKDIISMECCYKLVQMGHSCHTKVTKYVLQTESRFKHANWTAILAKNDEIFNECDQATIPEDKNYLSKCLEILGNDCGAEVFRKLVFDKNMSENSCEKLVKMGQPCHMNMVKALIRNPEMRDANAIELLKKSKKIFKQCSHIE